MMHIFQVPEKFNFLQTFDMFFKMFKVLILEYNPKYMNIMNFFGRYVYNSDENCEQNPRLLEVKNDIFRAPYVQLNTVQVRSEE